MRGITSAWTYGELLVAFVKNTPGRGNGGNRG